MHNQTKAFLFAGITVLLWSTVSTAFKLALQEMNPLQLITISMGISSLLLAIFIFITGEYRAFFQSTKKELLLSLMPGLMLFIYYVALFLAYDRLPAQIAQPINYSWALMLALLSVVILKQKLSLKEFFCLLFAYSGIVIISIGGAKHLGKPDTFGLVCVIFSTFLYALYWIYSTKTALSNTNQLFISFLVSALCGIFILVITKQSISLTTNVLLPALYIAFFELTIPFILWGMSMRCTQSVSRIASLPFLSPFLALFWVNLILKEHIAPTTYIGLAIILAGTYMQQRTRKNM